MCLRLEQFPKSALIQEIKELRERIVELETQNEDLQSRIDEIKYIIEDDTPDGEDEGQ